MLSEEKRKTGLLLMIGIVIGLMLGFIFGWMVGGSIKPGDPSVGIPRIDVYPTVFIGCIIAIGFAFLYVYLTEWSARGADHIEKPKAKEVE
jgi:uncharacterized BrkB/YihY/UPF0761 family membrane protein